MKKVGHNSEIFFDLLMNLKNKYLLKELWSGPMKKQNNFNIYNAPFKKKIKKNTWIYYYSMPVYQKS